MSNPKYTLVFSDDWCGIYVDGELEYENHTLSVIDLLLITEADFEQIWADEEWISERGVLPKDLNEVVEQIGD
jgi:hypothetical protein